MQKELQIIKQQEVLGKDFKVYGDWENPLFLAKDVAEWIEYSKNGKGSYKVSQMLSTIDDDEKIKSFLGGNNVVTQVSHGGYRENTEVWFLTEDGLYEVLMQSRKPIAKAFKKEVKKILKSVRKYGGYIKEELLEELLIFREIADEYLKMLKSERELSDKKERLLNDVIGYIESVEPQVEYCENVLECENAIPVSVIAKDYGMTANKFNQLLNFIKVQYKVGGVWVLYSDYDGNGYTASRTIIKYDKATVYTVWTQKGREFLYQKLKEHGILPEYEDQLVLECDFYE